MFARSARLFSRTSRQSNQKIIRISTLSKIHGQSTKADLGMVIGSVVQTRHIGTDIAAGIRNIFGGEVRGYTALLEEARETAIARMVEHAQRKGADAVLGMRLMTNSIAGECAEVMAYGTAVKLESKLEQTYPEAGLPIGEF